VVINASLVVSQDFQSMLTAIAYTPSALATMVSQSLMVPVWILPTKGVLSVMKALT